MSELDYEIPEIECAEEKADEVRVSIEIVELKKEKVDELDDAEIRCSNETVQCTEEKADEMPYEVISCAEDSEIEILADENYKFNVIECTVDSDIEIIGTKIHESNKIGIDLEEGEIKESDDSDKRVLCRYFQNGACWLGNNCRFIHVGVSNYKMFDSKITHSQRRNTIRMPAFQPLPTEPFAEEPPDSWDKGLREAKLLLLKAKHKKETDLDFEEKQLYQDLDYEVSISSKDSPRRKICLADEHKKLEKTDACSRLVEKKRKHRETPENHSRIFHKHRKREETPEGSPSLVDSNKKRRKIPEVSSLRRKYIETFRKKLPSPKSVKKVRSRTRERSNSWSQASSSSHSQSSSSSTSSCSDCKASYDTDNDFRKNKSKLERAFSRTFNTPETSRRSTSRRPISSNRRRRSLSRHSFIKRFIYRSYSKSPPNNSYSGKRQEKVVPRRPLHKKDTTLEVQRNPTPCSKKRSSPFSKILSENNNYIFEISSSDMTISSIKCTSISDSDVESKDNKSIKSSKSPVKNRKDVVSMKSNVLVNNRKLKKVHDKSNTHKIKEWLDTVGNSSRGNVQIPEVTKTICDEKKGSNSKPAENGKAKPCHKAPSGSETTDEELSADELELLKYIPNKNKKNAKPKEMKANNIEVTKASIKSFPTKSEMNKNNSPSTDANVKYPKPKIVYEYGSDTQCSPPKLVRGSNRGNSPKSIHDSGLIKGSSPKSIHDSESIRESFLPNCESNGANSTSKASADPVPFKNVEPNKSSPTKINDCGSKREISPKNIHDFESNRRSPTSKTSTENLSLMNVSGKNGIAKESSSELLFDATFSKKTIDPDPVEVKDTSAKKCGTEKAVFKKVANKNTSGLKNPRKKRWSDTSEERPLSEGELELLKYVSIGNPVVSKAIRKNTKKNSVALAAKKAESKKTKTGTDKHSDRKTKGNKNVKTEMSRREQLIKQLKDVELAIAKKKKQSKLEYKRLKKMTA